MSLGAELRKARKRAEMSQEQVAFAAEIDRAYLSQLENDRKSPTVETLLRVCAALGARASVLLARVERSQDAKRQPRRRAD